jgi:S-adenosylmethionine synthetase
VRLSSIGTQPTAADCVLVSEIGRPVADPAIVDAAISGSMSNQLRTIVADVVNQQTFHVADLTEALLQRR